MRITLILILFISFNLKAQQSPTVALTAGSEFSPVQLVDGQSITESHTVTPTMVWTSEAQIQPQVNSHVPPAKTTGGLSKDKTVLLAALLIGIALFYFNRKNNNARKIEEQTAWQMGEQFEAEEKQELKKEVWNLMATQPIIETETIPENIIATKPESYSQHAYTCDQGELIIEQAYQNPNVGESVLLNAKLAPTGKYKIGLLLSIEVVNGKISKVLS